MGETRNASKIFAKNLSGSKPLEYGHVWENIIEVDLTEIRL
jgi:hypothetical protein